jgi:putative membrane protein
MEEFVNIKYVMNALVFSGIGLFVLIGSFIIIDALTPRVSVWKELVEKQNMAVAIFFGAAMLGVAMIIAAAVHG